MVAGLFEAGGANMVRDPVQIVVIVRGSEESERKSMLYLLMMWWWWSVRGG